MAGLFGGGGSIVTLQVTGDSGVATERRFPRDITISQLKDKLYPITGTEPSVMQLTLSDGGSRSISVQGDDRVLGYFSPEDHWTLYVKDPAGRKARSEFEDLSRVEKFELADEEYEKKQGTVRKYIQAKRAAGLLPDPVDKSELGAEEAKSIKVGDRCEVEGGRRGAVRFVGKTKFAPGWWVGVQYDEPWGKNDGSVKGERYFECAPKYGGFIRPSKVKVGEYPEEDLELSSEEDEI